LGLRTKNAPSQKAKGEYGKAVKHEDLDKGRMLKVAYYGTDRPFSTPFGSRKITQYCDIRCLFDTRPTPALWD